MKETASQTRMFREPFPILTVSDPNRSVRFYSDNFDFELTYRWPEQGPIEFAYLQLGVHAIAVGSPRAGESIGGAQGCTLCMYVDDTDRACERLLAAGVRQVAPPWEAQWGERMAIFEDPDGTPILITSQAE
jgi:uncharacterized glyoxalase superfamily protein PhnB